MTPNHYRPERDTRRAEMFRPLRHEDRDGESAGLTCLADRDPVLRECRVADAIARIAREQAEAARKGNRTGAKASKARRTRLRGSGEVLGLLLAGLVAIVGLAAGGIVPQHEIHDRLIDEVGSLQANLFADPVELVEQGAADTEVHGLRLHLGSLVGHQQHDEQVNQSDHLIQQSDCKYHQIEDYEGVTPPARMVRDGSRVEQNRKQSFRKECIIMAQSKQVWRCHWTKDGKVCGYLIVANAKPGHERKLIAFVKGGDEPSLKVAQIIARATKNYSHPAKVHLRNRTPEWLLAECNYLFGMTMFPLDDKGKRAKMPFYRQGKRASYATMIANRMVQENNRLDVYLADIAQIAWWDEAPKWLRMACNNAREFESGLRKSPVTDQLGGDHGERAVASAAA